MVISQKFRLTILVISTIARSYQLSAMESGPGGVPRKDGDTVRFLLQASGDQAYALLAMVNDTAPTALEIAFNFKPCIFLSDSDSSNKFSKWSPRGATQIIQIGDLWLACQAGWIECVQSILRQADDQYTIISTQDIFGRTALHFAADKGSLEIVKLLVDVAVKANMLQDFITTRTNRAEDCEETALDVAKRLGYVDIVTFLEKFSIVQ